jgi:excisionase family DNA binding protein
MFDFSASNSEFMSIDECARRTNVHPITIKRAIQDHELEALKVRRRVLIAESAWREWLSKCRLVTARAA